MMCQSKVVTYFLILFFILKGVKDPLIYAYLTVDSSFPDTTYSPNYSPNKKIF
jgi:hypothetical protein